MNLCPCISNPYPEYVCPMLRHWKANHADMVMRNRALQDRPDLKERASGYRALIERLEKAEARLRELGEMTNP